MEGVKCVVVGDPTTAKTVMLISYIWDGFPTEYEPTFLDNYQANVMVDGRPISLGLWNTSDQEDYPRLRPTSYPNTDVFIVCYSVISPTSLQNVRNKWLPEIRHHCPNASFLLVDTKSDLRKDTPALQKLKAKGACLVSFERAQELGEEFGAARVMECSAKTQAGIEAVFDAAIGVGLKARRAKRVKKRNKCSLL